jgi:hypothetical protein
MTNDLILLNDPFETVGVVVSSSLPALAAAAFWLDA